MKKFFAEFKEFIAKGNVVDMAVGVVVGGAFKEIVNALVNGIVMPLIGLITGGGNISEWKWVISEAVIVDGVETVPENAVLYGAFVQTIIDFLIIALCIFVTLKVFLAMQERTKKLLHKKAEEAAEVVEEAPAETEMDVLKDIRTLLTAKTEE